MLNDINSSAKDDIYLLKVDNVLTIPQCPWVIFNPIASYNTISFFSFWF